MDAIALALAAAAGAAAALALVAAASAARWRTRALTAEGLLDRASRRRSDASARGNDTRKTEDRQRFVETAEQLNRGVIAKLKRELGRHQ